MMMPTAVKMGEAFDVRGKLPKQTGSSNTKDNYNLLN